VRTRSTFRSFRIFFLSRAYIRLPLQLLVLSLFFFLLVLARFRLVVSWVQYVVPFYRLSAVSANLVGAMKVSQDTQSRLP
jgi:hypothetical protein